MWIVTKVIRMNVQIPSSIEITESQAKWDKLLEKNKNKKTKKELPSILAFPKASEEENNLEPKVKIKLFLQKLFTWLCQVAACGIKFPGEGSNLGPLHWEHGVLATGPPGKSHRGWEFDAVFKSIL